ncbi:hypothetical protein HTZ84_17040 [Haloterrigena sp. SYSU A558-1]|uniref:Uncharacterized protein n=1 Tax=Haloterrigena gelatinilytica TaxID=2741724 RepID=A0A8J8KEP3_9EURY|nr:hypothetical protein [Haloterrigena gelatinilytica]NUB90192.1 hypothetical protein [Haloterrigena gelatinilytica]NUC73987.1 hypothetical protein [Haloterrigena gelatinilytica]
MMADKYLTNWKSTLKRGYILIVIILLLGSVFDNGQSVLALRFLIQIAVVVYGASAGYRHRNQTVPTIAALLIAIGGGYGCYLVWGGSEAFTNLLYLGLVGVGFLGDRAQDSR